MGKSEREFAATQSGGVFVERVPEGPAPMTKLDKPLRREIQLEDTSYTLTIDPDGMKLVQKGKRKGVELKWQDIVNGDAAIAAALQASLQALR